MPKRRNERNRNAVEANDARRIAEIIEWSESLTMDQHAERERIFKADMASAVIFNRKGKA